MTAPAGSERLGSAGYVRPIMVEFAANVRSVGEARAFVREELAGFASVDDAELCVSELATNAVLHGSERGSVFWVVVRGNGRRVYVAVIDSGGSEVPRLVEAGDGAVRGRGLRLVAAYASDWGVEPVMTGGYRVWAEVAAA